jgi:hypothetical protein
MELFLSGAWIFILVNTEFGTYLTSIHWIPGIKWAEHEGYHSPVSSAMLMCGAILSLWYRKTVHMLVVVFNIKVLLL